MISSGMTSRASVHKMTHKTASREARYLYLFLTLLIISITIPDIFSSFWLDETGTFWIIADTLLDAISRAEWWSATPPLYYICIWAWSQVFGSTELSLRLFSILFMSFTCLLLYRLARTWFSHEGALLTILFFLALPAVSFAAIDARPYALGLFFLVLCWLSYLRWLETLRPLALGMATLAAIATIYTHYLLAPGLFPMLFFHDGSGLRWNRRQTVAAVAALLAVLVSVLPLLHQLYTIFQQRSDLNWASSPSPTHFVAELIAYPLSLFVILGMFYAYQDDGKELGGKLSAMRPSFFPFIYLAFLPTLFIAVLSWAAEIHLFIARYMIYKCVGLAFVFCWVTMQIHNVILRRILVIATISCAVIINVFQVHTHGQEKWREAIAFVNEYLSDHPDHTIAVVSGFVESNRSGELNKADHFEIVFAPLTAYRLNATPISLPRIPDQFAQQRLRDRLVPAAIERGGCSLICSTNCEAYVSSIEKLLKPKGMRAVQFRDFGAVRVVRFGPLVSASPPD